MSLLVWVLCAFGGARASPTDMPQCVGSEHSCAMRERHAVGGWRMMEYLVQGARMSVAIHNSTVRWSCAGLDPTRTSSTSAPRFTKPRDFREVELMDCDIPLEKYSYTDIFRLLNVNSTTVQSLNISMSLTERKWPSTEHLKKIKKETINKPAGVTNLQNSLEYLTLRGIPMTSEQLISIHNVKNLTLIDAGLEDVMDLTEFSKLYRLELRERNLLNAEQLAYAPALRELVLEAPDAGLAPMPQLRNTTFIDVYMVGRVFGDCRNLKHLALEGGDLEEIPSYWLIGCSELKSLKLTGLKRLRHLPDDLLADSTELRVLDISDNSLVDLYQGLLENTRHLEYLDVSGNKLWTLPKDLPLSLTRVFACGNIGDTLPLRFRDSRTESTRISLNKTECAYIENFE